MSVEVRFVGGPCDGMYRDYPGDEPPQLIQCFAPIFGRGADTQELEPTQIWYQTLVSPFSEGPLWVAVLVP